MTDKDDYDYCAHCDVEPPALKFKCPECKHNPDKEQIIIDVNKYFKKATNNSGQPLTYIINYADLYEAIIQLNEEFIKKVQRCEELKKNNQILCDLYKNVDACLQIRSETFDRYRKALEEIERAFECDIEYGSGLHKQILDIINKAKGKNPDEE